MKTLKKYEFKKSAARSKFDWDTILDGNIYSLTQGEDFTCQTSTMTMMLRDRANKRYKKVQINVDDEAGTVIVQATEMTGEQRDAEDARRERRKASIASRKSEKKEQTAAPDEVADEPVIEEVAA